MSDNYRGIDEDGAYKSRRSTQSTSSRAGQRGETSQQRPANGQRAAASQQRPANAQRAGTSQQRPTNGQRAAASQQRPANGQRTGTSQQRSAGAQRQSQGTVQQNSADGQYIGSRRRTADGQPQRASSQSGTRTGTTAARSGANDSYGGYSGGYSRQTNTQSVNANGAGETLPKTAASVSHSTRTERRSAVGRYTGSSDSTPNTARTANTQQASPKSSSSGGFTVNISEDDYYDSDATMQEISEAKSNLPRVRRKSTASSESALAVMDANPTTAKRIVTGSMGDTYQIQDDDDVMAPRQLRSRQKSVRKRNRGNLIALVYAAVVCSVSILLAYYMIVGVNDMFALVKDRNNKDGIDIVVEVPKGASIDDITKLLDENGVVEYPFFFKSYAKFSKKDTGFKAGTFTLNTKSDYNQLLTKLRLPAGADKSTITVTIPEGLTVEQVAVIMEENSVCEAENFIKSAKEVEFTQKFLANVDTKNENRIYGVEGYLYPDTYNFYLSEGSVNAINRLLNEYQKHWTDEYAEKAKEIGMSMDQVITLASIVEREASKSEDRYNVASVFANRLKNSKGTGGKLQSDATRWYPYATKKELLASDKLTQAEKDDWINNNTGVCDTYRLKGLPPGPICSPSINSIEAVLYHDNTGYYYFCSDAEGKFYFAKTLNEHNANLKKAGLA